MTRILWHSAPPHVQTGYGTQTSLFVPRLAAHGHDMAISSTWGLMGSAQVLEDGTTVYPADDNWGNTTLPMFAEHHRADLVIALMDAWVLNPEMVKRLPGLAVWCPVDHDPTPPRVAAFFRHSGARPIAMSKFGYQRLRDDGLDPLYVPHGVDTSVFTPEHRDEMRASLGWTPDDFAVGIVANNAGGGGARGTVPRKAFPQALMAFSSFRDSHPGAKLYIHSELSGKQQFGVDLAAMVERFEIPETAVQTTSRLAMEVGVTSAQMASLYSAFDVLLSPSYGEGFGVPIVEAQSCGVPVIVSDWTAMPELVGAGWKLQGEPWYDPQHDSFFMYAFVADIVRALDEAYDTRNDPQLRAAARQFALQYDADLITETYWNPVLEQLGRPREVGPLPNREMRRKAAKKVAA